VASRRTASHPVVCGFTWKHPSFGGQTADGAYISLTLPQVGKSLTELMHGGRWDRAKCKRDSGREWPQQDVLSGTNHPSHEGGSHCAPRARTHLGTADILGDHPAVGIVDALGFVQRRCPNTAHTVLLEPHSTPGPCALAHRLTPASRPCEPQMLSSKLDSHPQAPARCSVVVEPASKRGML